MKCYQKDYPRPQFVRSADSWENLNGPWDFASDDADVGRAGAWFRSFPSSHTIRVPFTYETAKSGIADPKVHRILWYHRRVSLETSRKAGKRVLLHLEGSDYRTELWVNGVFVGSHDGAYTRFSFDLTAFLAKGLNDLTLRIEDSFDRSQPRGKQRWKDANFGCWYVQTTGIWKTLWLEYVPQECIERIKMTPLLGEGKLALEADIRIQDAPEGSSPLYLAAAVEYQGLPVTRLLVEADKRRLSATVDVRNSRISEWGLMPWSPEHPHLYDITFQLLRDGVPLDTVGSYFGMRDIHIEEGQVLLNGAPLYQRLILDQGYWKESHLTAPDEEALILDIDQALAAGYNGVRKHQKLEDERFLYWADVKGLLVWSEMASTYEFTDAAVGRFTQEWLEILAQYYNHPSIITWTPFNESWGVPGIGHDAAQQGFTKAIYYLTKAFDPYRPVISNDGWEHTVSDIITLHDYEEAGDAFLARYAALESMLENRGRPNRTKPVFAQGHGYQGQPIIISEFGGIAFNNDDSGWGYGSKVNTQEEFIRRFAAITRAIQRLDRICGYCYTQLTDVQQEINGLLDGDRNFKVDPAILKQINEGQVSGAP
jgi:beta-galactosidase/beta-glucuronidase